MSYHLTIVEEALDEPVTDDEAKDNSSVASGITAHTPKFIRWIAAARRLIEERTNRQINAATLKLTLDRFPLSCEPILLPRPPLRAVNSIKYIDSSGVQQTWAAENYVVSTGREPGRVLPAYGKSWPAARQQPDAVEVEFQAGFEDGHVPEDYKVCILMMVDDWFVHRSGEGELSPWVQSMIEQFRFGDEMLDYEARR